MSDDRFLERLREAGRPLRYDPDAIMRARIAARVRARIAAAPTVDQFLARWFRALAVSLSGIALVASLSMVWIEERSEATTMDSISGNSSVEISVGGDSYFVND